MTGPRPTDWMLYGAYGTTGRLILDEALRRGHRPVLAGRDAAQLALLSRATGLSTRLLALDDAAGLRTALSCVSGVLHAAGPYQLTGPPMRAACLDVGCWYMDINGEIEDFGAAMACDAQARNRGIAIIPGVGYGVTFAECLAAYLSLRLPDATWLRLSLATHTGTRSRGAWLSTAAAIATGGREIYQGQPRPRALAFSSWRTPGPDALRRRFSAAPLAELVAVGHSTGIPNIIAGIPLSRPVAALMRVAGRPLSRLMTWQAARVQTVAAPSLPPEAITSLRSRVWAEAGNTEGNRMVAMLETGEGYRVAAAAAVRAVELQMQEPRQGALTPVQAFGAHFALLVPGTHIQDL